METGLYLYHKGKRDGELAERERVSGLVENARRENPASVVQAVCSMLLDAIQRGDQPKEQEK